MRHSAGKGVAKDVKVTVVSFGVKQPLVILSGDGSGIADCLRLEIYNEFTLSVFNLRSHGRQHKSKVRNRNGSGDLPGCANRLQQPVASDRKPLRALLFRVRPPLTPKAGKKPRPGSYVLPFSGYHQIADVMNRRALVKGQLAKAGVISPYLFWGIIYLTGPSPVC